jgi:hypothetical protein
VLPSATIRVVLPRPHGLFDVDQAGSCFFERQAAAGFSREQDSGCQAQVRFMADTERDGVRRQRIQQREQGARMPLLD